MVPESDAVLISGKVEPEEFDWLVHACLEGLISSEGLFDESDFYICKKCNADLDASIRKVIGMGEVWDEG